MENMQFTYQEFIEVEIDDTVYNINVFNVPFEEMFED